MTDDQQRPSRFGSIFPSFSAKDPSLNVPVSADGGGMVSPYMNFDPNVIYDSGSEYIIPEGGSRRRGRFEMAFAQIGTSVMVGGLLGGLYGLKETATWPLMENLRNSQQKNRVINGFIKRGAAFGQMFGTIGFLYSGCGVVYHLLGVEDKPNTLLAGTTTGMIFKSTAGRMAILKGGGVGLVVSLGIVAATMLSENKKEIVY